MDKWLKVIGVVIISANLIFLIMMIIGVFFPMFELVHWITNILMIAYCITLGFLSIKKNQDIKK